MRAITKEMIKIYKMKELGYDFMGYTFNKPEELSFHHLIIPHRDCQRLGYGNGYELWNGAILKQKTSHEYLHTIELYNRDLFLQITEYMIQENKNYKIDIDTLRKIRQILLYFEEEYKNDTNSKGELLLKKKYLKERIDLK